MDFSQRGSHQNQVVSDGAPAEQSASSGSKGKKRPTSLLTYITALLLLSVTVLIIALLVSVVTSPSKNETKYVKSNQLQAVFLNNGQVYFGRIASLNDEYVRLQNIYYLRVNQAVQPKQTAATSTNPNDVSLVKLGCELHGPDDQMVINRTQITFWENLKTDGQVAKAVADYIKANPNGQTCSTSTTTTPSTTKKP